ncbi:Tudor domain-containing protein PHF20L1 [Camponotus floridanus]|uniref:Tudor domain-containing protein PHF20L1 n=1 Tax=Camponotus floridanus TaxID=104421 RepID=E1ZV72_CAMFO|nr:Tudor domain-containing protein PHF20L1 [Camponotus floridanus]
MGMARKCCVRSCEADVREARAKGLPLHKFPKDVALRDRWLASGGFDESFKPTPGQVVCHRHFKRADYDHAARGGHKFLLKRGSVPTVFADYDNHPDPVIMSVKSSTSYAQEDLDLINSEILNLEHSASPLLSEARTPKSDSCGETCYSRPESSTDSLNLPDGSEVMENECKMASLKEEIATLVNDKLVENSDNKVNTVAMQLGIVEAGATMKADVKDLIIKEELKNIKLSDDKEFDKSEELKPKVLNRDGTKFYPGAKLEAKDFNEKWQVLYSAKVVETDWDEREVLIHFDKWSSRFDEWIPMDSSRLRILQTPPQEAKTREFSVGERVLATWADGRKYPAKVNAVLSNDKYDVLFDDGYAKVVKSSKMTKIAENPTKQLSGLEGYIGSKQERRDKKRKHTVMELFNTHSRKRTKNDADKALKKEETVVKESEESSMENKVEIDGTLFGACYDPGTNLLRGFETNPSKIKSYSKKSKKEISKNDTDHEEDVGPEWIDGEPQGTESYIVDGNDGPRRSIIVPDRRLPSGWEKHFTQRKAGTSAGKWDVLFIHKQTGKKFRSRNDIRVFMENQGQYDFNPENFDFCIHRRKRNHASRSKQEVTPEKKIKTLLPKTKTLSTPENTLQVTNNTTTSTPNSSTPVTSTTDGAVFIGLRGGLRVEMEDSAYKCPKEGCNKNFRKENLLQMHIKHYHPEYSKFLGSTPKVEDLAYARTIGESIDDIIPKKSTTFLDKINKFAKKKSLPEKSTLLQSTLNTMQPASPSISSSVMPELEEEIDQTEKCNDLQKEDMKIETMSSISNHSMEMDDDIEKKRENICALSPGTLFDMKVKEEKAQGGIKTLLPVRPSTTEVQKIDRTKPLDEITHIERTKGQKKRQISEHSIDLPIKGKKRHGMSDLTDNFGDLDDSAMDVEGPAALMYRYSRRKSDSKSDENSQNSQLNDSRIEKGDPLKGDLIKTDINNDTEESEGVMMMINGEMIKVEQLRREEIINCTCGFMEEDGLMIQKKDHPKLYLWAKNWEKMEIPKIDIDPVPIMEIVKAGPSFTDVEIPRRAEIKTDVKLSVKDDQDEKSIASDSELMKILEEDSTHSDESRIINKREGFINSKDSHILLDALTSGNSDVKERNVAMSDIKTENADFLADKTMNDNSTSESLSLNSGPLIDNIQESSIADVESEVSALPQPFIPEPEAPIDPTECRMRLLEHIEHFQCHIDSRLTSIEAQICALEAMDPDELASDPHVQPRTKQTVQMLLRDLSTVRKLAALC